MPFPLVMALFGTSLLASTPTLCQEDADGLRLRRVYAWPDRWMATEMLDAPTLSALGQMLDVDTGAWIAACEAGTARAIVLAQVDGAPGQSMIVRVGRVGTGWDLDVAYHPGMRFVQPTPSFLQRIAELLYVLERQQKTS